MLMRAVRLLETGPGTISERFELGRVVRLPRIDDFKLTVPLVNSEPTEIMGVCTRFAHSFNQPAAGS
jgi:hypothetical protein